MWKAASQKATKLR